MCSDGDGYKRKSEPDISIPCDSLCDSPLKAAETKCSPLSVEFRILGSCGCRRRQIVRFSAISALFCIVSHAHGTPIPCDRCDSQVGLAIAVDILRHQLGAPPINLTSLAPG